MDQYAREELIKRIENASPAQRVSILYEHASSLLDEARLSDDVDVRKRLASKVLNIVAVLRDALNAQAGTVAGQLAQTYDTIAGFVERVALRVDTAAAETACGMFAGLSAAWNEAMAREQGQ